MTISAKIVADSISPQGKRITTIEVEFPRIILAEVNTHKIISKNYSSTRAIPILTQLELIANNPTMPTFYGKNQSGMVADEELSNFQKAQADCVILDMLDYVSQGVKKLHEIGLHKQSAGRYLEPWMHVKGVITSTEWENFFWLRKHPDAQPEFQKLATAIFEAREGSTPILLKKGEWHVPYYCDGFWKPGDYVKNENGSIQMLDDKRGYTLKEALMISSSCTAQVSYRKTDDSLEKAITVYNRLNIGSKDVPQHVSPTEHQATPMQQIEPLQYPIKWEDGVTAYHKELGFMSGNLAGWIQHRQLIEGNTKW